MFLISEPLIVSRVIVTAAAILLFRHRVSRDCVPAFTCCDFVRATRKLSVRRLKISATLYHAINTRNSRGGTSADRRSFVGRDYDINENRDDVSSDPGASCNTQRVETF